MLTFAVMQIITLTIEDLSLGLSILLLTSLHIKVILASVGVPGQYHVLAGQ